MEKDIQNKSMEMNTLSTILCLLTMQIEVIPNRRFNTRIYIQRESCQEKYKLLSEYYHKNTINYFINVIIRTLPNTS